MGKIKIYKEFYSVEGAENEPKSLFIFGDNNIQQGIKGQAMIRKCHNAHGIPTKKYPGYAVEHYYNDADYDNNIERIDIAIASIIDKAPRFHKIYLPNNGLGTGLSDLPNKAPKTFKYLNKAIRKMIKEIDGQDCIEWSF